MQKVTLRRLAASDHDQVMGIRPGRGQEQLVAGVEASLAEVATNDALTPFAVYDASQLGLPEPDQPPVGFAVTEVVASVGFILRVLIDADHQRKGYGRATMTELVRRLRLQPDVELIATSHRTENLPMARLCAGLGFEPWATPFPPPAGEIYLCLRP
jgi:diamine N-acetyltransferase